MQNISTDTGSIYIGNAREVCSLYKNFTKRKLAMPVFSDFPKFNMGKFYGLCVTTYDSLNEREIDPVMQVISGDTALAIIHDL